MDADLIVNLEPKVETDFRELLRERGFASINEFIVNELKVDRAKKRRERLEDVAARMWPNGTPESRGRS